MERRRFIQTVGAGAGALVFGGALWARAVLGRSQFANQLVSEASPILVKKEHSEIGSIPESASEELKLWFTGACLNSAQFIEYICEESFAARLGQFSTQRDRELCIENEFLSRVISHSEIYNRIELIAKEAGTTLDRNWKSCCDQIAATWKLKLSARSMNLADSIQTRLETVVASELDMMISQSTSTANRPSLISSAVGIGKASLMLLPLVRLPAPYNAVVIPAFALIALSHFANYAIGMLTQDKGVAKAAISDRLAILGNRIAGEFSSELKTRIADLHAWQNKSLRKTAGEYAYESIGII